MREITPSEVIPMILPLMGRYKDVDIEISFSVHNLIVNVFEKEKTTSIQFHKIDDYKPRRTHQNGSQLTIYVPRAIDCLIELQAILIEDFQPFIINIQTHGTVAEAV